MFLIEIDWESDKKMTVRTFFFVLDINTINPAFLLADNLGGTATTFQFFFCWKMFKAFFKTKVVVMYQN
jgi:hypothetical protein